MYMYIPRKDKLLMSVYQQSSCDLFKAMNSVNLFTSLYLFCKHGFFTALPHSMVVVTSYFFWRNTTNLILMTMDYSAVGITICFTYYNSFLQQKEGVITPLLMCVLYTCILSMHFKNKNEDYCIYFHSLTYMIGNIAIVYTFT